MTAVEPPHFFIVGSGRSGTTLLRLYLQRHPDVVIPPESHFLLDVAATWPDPSATLDRSDLVTLGRQFTQSNAGRDWVGIDAPSVLSRLDRPSVTSAVGALFRSVDTSGAEGVLIGDKTPPYGAIVPWLRRLNPTARFVHAVRDPRDVVASLRLLWHRRRTCAEIGRLWSEKVETIVSAQHRDPELFLTVRYEDLVCSPQEVTNRVWAHLGLRPVPLDDAHRDWVSLVTDDERRSGIHNSLAREPSPADAHRWRRRPTRDDHAVSLVTRRQLREFGYDEPSVRELALGASRIAQDRVEAVLPRSVKRPARRLAERMLRRS